MRPREGSVILRAIDPVRFETRPDAYKHWKLDLQDAGRGIARLVLDVKDHDGLRPDYELKQNSYDLGVDVELADAVQRLRFEHPEVRALVFSSAKDRIFCSGANIYMLGSSTHAFKVNFCKFTNETRLYLEEASQESGIKAIAALNGIAAGGGYELALACDEIYLQEDGNSAVSLPECPLLAVLPGTGGLTRLVDKRKVRRDLADVFSTVAEGIRGNRAKDWGLVDGVIPRSKFNDTTTKRAEELASKSPRAAAKGAGMKLPPMEVTRVAEAKITSTYKYVTLTIDPKKRVAELEVRGPDHDPPKNADEMRAKGASWWAVQAFRELDDAILDLRFNWLDVGLLVVRTKGELEKVVAHDKALASLTGDWLGKEIQLLQKRVLKRIDVTSRSIFSLIEEGSCFAGSLLELALAGDRIYMKDDEDHEDEIRVAVDLANFGPMPMANGLTRLQSRFLADPSRADALKGKEGPLTTQEAMKIGLVTLSPDALDWDDEVRVAIEERAAMSPDAMTGMEASLRWGGPETMETKIFGRLSAWQNWIFTRPNATGAKGALTMYGKPERPSSIGAAREERVMSNVVNDTKIPNNVDLSSDKKLQRALEQWQPNFINWWLEMGPEGFQKDDVWLRTAISVDADGWAHFDYVKMPDYRWGIFLADKVEDRKIHFGDNIGQPVWQEVPGEHRNVLRRLIVTQGDTEPASVEQQRLLGQTCPSLYDLRNLFQVNVEEGRHLWAMVYLLHSYFGRDGREEAEGLLQRRSGDSDKPRILGAFNAPCSHWLSFFMFTYFTDRDGKYQLLALAESGFDPLSRTTRFMLTEEAHHMFVGESGVQRIIERTLQLMKEAGTSEDVRKLGGIDLPTMQKYLNLWYSLSLDLFGGEISSNAASFFAAGLKGRAFEEKEFQEHTALNQVYAMQTPKGTEEVALRNAMNEVLRDAYVEDSQRGVDKWNRAIAKAGIQFEFKLPNRRFHRHIGLWAEVPTTPEGEVISKEEFEKRKGDWLPSDADEEYVKSLMTKPIYEKGKMANWIAPPPRGIKGQPVDYEYVRHEPV